MRPLLVGIDLGGTKTTAAVCSTEGQLGERISVPTPAAAGPEAVLDVLADLAGRWGVPDAIGVGAAGVIDVDRGVVVSATDVFPGWVGTPVADRLAEATGARVRVQNDVDAHAAGEAWCGAGRGAESMLMVTVGTGVGASLVFGGEPRRGAHHLSGEIGHQPTPGAEGLRCGCGRLGHLEAVAAGPAIARRHLGVDGLPASDARTVFAAAAAGDAAADRVIEEAAAATGRAIAAVVTVVDPELVVIGGGVGESGDRWWRPMERTLRAELVDVLAGIRVCRPQLGSGAALIGAARSAARLLEER